MMLSVNLPLFYTQTAHLSPCPASSNCDVCIYVCMHACVYTVHDDVYRLLMSTIAASI